MKEKNVSMIKPKKTREKMGFIDWAILVLLVLYSISIIFLLLWGLNTSLKTRNDFRLNVMGLPKKFEWANYVMVITNWNVTPQRTNLNIGFLPQLLYTLLYTFGGAFLQTFCFCIMAYISSKYKYLFSKIIYTVVIITMVIPIVGSTPATIKFMSSLRLYDTFLGAYIMKFNFLGMYFLIFHASFSSLSNEYTEAAVIDGANEWQVMFKIMFPLVMPTFATIFLIKFIEFWNDYSTPLIYLPTHPTLAYGVQDMSTNGDVNKVPERIASCMVLALPITVLFIVFRNKIMGNVTMGGVKE